MSIKYSLIPNHLTDDPDDYAAVVQSQRTRTEEDIVDEIINRGSTLSRADIISVFSEENAVIQKFLSDGNRVKRDIYTISASISGKFNGRNDRFDPSRHEVHQNMASGPVVKQGSNGISVEKVSPNKVRPNPEFLMDFMSDTENETLTPGGTVRLEGNNLKVDPNDPEQGIWFLGPDKTETKVELIMQNMPSELMFQVPPELTAGEYDIEVRALIRGHSSIKSGRLNEVLIVP